MNDNSILLAWALLSKNGGGGGSVAIDNKTIKKNDDNELCVSIDGTTLVYDETSGHISAHTTALQPMKSDWKSSSLSTTEAATAILSDPTTRQGDGFLATVYWNDLPGQVTQAEVKAFVLLKSGGSQSIVQFECTSGTTSPFAWFYNSYDTKHEWRSYVPIYNKVDSTSKTMALSANMGKTLQDQITNLKNIGRFLSVWKATTGKPTTDPTTLPYTYRTGDYYRVGAVNKGYYIHQLTVSGTTTNNESYTTAFGFISDSKSSITNFRTVVNQLYILGYRSFATSLEANSTIGSQVYTNSFVTSESGQLKFYIENSETHAGIDVGTASSATTVLDNVSVASIHNVYAHGYDVASKEYQIDLAFPSTTSAAYTTTGQVADVLKALHYSLEYPCTASGTCGSGGSVYFAYGTSTSALVLLDINKQEIGRITTQETPEAFTDTVTGSEAPNYRPDGTTYTGAASTVVETEELEVGSVYYFDGEKWVLQKAGGSGIVQDVQINGTTILDLNSGIANIPIAGANLGVVKPGSGLAMNSTTGSISVNRASNSAIEGKSEDYNPIVPSNLNKAIMEGLGNNSLTWSDAYKTSARNTIGAYTAIEYTGSESSYEDGVFYYTVE